MYTRKPFKHAGAERKTENIDFCGSTQQVASFQRFLLNNLTALGQQSGGSSHVSKKVLASKSDKGWCLRENTDPLGFAVSPTEVYILNRVAQMPKPAGDGSGFLKLMNIKCRGQAPSWQVHFPSCSLCKTKQNGRERKEGWSRLGTYIKIC